MSTISAEQGLEPVATATPTPLAPRQARALQKPGGPNLLAKVIGLYLDSSAVLARKMEEAVTAADVQRDIGHDSTQLDGLDRSRNLIPRAQLHGDPPCEQLFDPASNHPSWVTGPAVQSA